MHDNVFLYSDDKQWIIAEEVIKKNGEKHRANSMYYPIASSAIEAYFKKYQIRKVKYLDENGKEKEISLNELFKILKESENKMEKLSKDIDKKLVKL